MPADSGQQWTEYKSREGNENQMNQAIFQSLHISLCTSDASSFASFHVFPSSISHPIRPPVSAMADPSNPTDLHLQIAFGIFGILSLAVAIASLHSRHSLGAAWLRSLRSCFRRLKGPREGLHRDEEDSVGMLSLSSVDIPSPRISFDDTPVSMQESASTIDYGRLNG